MICETLFDVGTFPVDENETRREVVRRKTARYLIKAEEIHKQHPSQNLSSSATGDTGTHPSNRWDVSALSIQLWDTDIANVVHGCCEKSLLEIVAEILKYSVTVSYLLLRNSLSF